VLQLIHAVKEYCGQVGRLFAHQVAQDGKPLPLSFDVQADQRFVILLRVAAFQSSLLQRHVHGQLTRIEVRDGGCQPFVESRGVAGQTKMTPRNPAGHNISVDLANGKGHRKIQDRRLAPLPRQHRPDRGARHVAGIQNAKLPGTRPKLKSQKVEDAVISRTSAGHQRCPGRRCQRRNNRCQFRPRAGGDQAFQERHHAFLHQRIQDGERRAV
jgi:hypothetical protein